MNLKILSILSVFFISANSYAEKPKLDRYVDLVFPSTQNQKENLDLPKTVDLSDILTIGKNQSKRGSCSFFAVMGLVEAVVKKDLKVEVNLSEEFLIYTTKALDGVASDEDGSNTSENLNSLVSHGALLEKDWGYQPSWFDKGLPCENEKMDEYGVPSFCYSHRAPKKNIMSRLINFENFKIRSVSRNLNSLLTFLAKEQRPIAVSVPVNFDGWPNSGDVFHNEELRQACLNNPKSCGGHVIVLYGYDLDRKVFYFKNSWGKDWGHEGRGTITFDTIDQYAGWGAFSANVDGEIKFPKELNAPEVEAEKFSVNLNYSDSGDVKVKVDVSIPSVEGQLVYISSFLTHGSEHQVLAYPEDLKEKMGDSNVRSLFFSLPTVGHQTNFKPLLDVSLEFPSGLMKLDFIQDLINVQKTELFWRTTAYVYNDIEGYKILKRIFTAVPEKI
jgi:hypothetical protein